MLRTSSLLLIEQSAAGPFIRSLPSAVPEYLISDLSLPAGHREAKKMAPKNIENEGFGTFGAPKAVRLRFQILFTHSFKWCEALSSVVAYLNSA